MIESDSSSIAANCSVRLSRCRQLMSMRRDGSPPGDEGPDAEPSTRTWPARLAALLLLVVVVGAMTGAVVSSENRVRRLLVGRFVARASTAASFAGTDVSYTLGKEQTLATRQLASATVSQDGIQLLPRNPRLRSRPASRQRGSGTGRDPLQGQPHRHRDRLEVRPSELGGRWTRGGIRRGAVGCRRRAGDGVRGPLRHAVRPPGGQRCL